MLEEQVIGGGGGIVHASLSGDDEDPAWASDARMYQRLNAVLKGTYMLPQCVLEYAGASIGVFEADPLGMTPDEMLKHADRLMYADKSSRRERSPGLSSPRA